MPYHDDIPFVPGSKTSHMAARDVRERTPTQRARIVSFLRSQGSKGATCDEICRALSLRNQSVCPRLRELHVAGQVVKLDVTRATRAASKAHVYVVPEHSIDHVTVPYEPYVLLLKSTFEEIFNNFNDDWRNHYWRMLEKCTAAQGRKKGRP